MTKQLLIASLLVCATARAVEDEDAAMGRRVQALLHAHQTDVFGCVQKETRPPTGEMLVRVFVGEAGREVARAEVLKDQTGSQTLRRCIGDKIRGWDVSSLKAGDGDQLVFPLAFTPGNKAGVKLEAKPLDRATRISVETAVYVVHGAIKVGSEMLKTDDVAWVMPPATIERVNAEPSLVVMVTGEGGSLGGHAMVAHGKVQKALPIAGGQGTATLYLDGAGEPIAIDKLTAARGVKIPPHKHDASDELLYIVSGKGMTTIDGKAVFTSAGTTLRIPAGVEHSLTVDEPLVAVQVYAPAGPEQRFKMPPPPEKK